MYALWAQTRTTGQCSGTRGKTRIWEVLGKDGTGLNGEITFYFFSYIPGDKSMRLGKLQDRILGTTIYGVLEEANGCGTGSEVPLVKF